jgi:hypothetical protein
MVWASRAVGLKVASRDAAKRDPDSLAWPGLQGSPGRAQGAEHSGGRFIRGEAARRLGQVVKRDVHTRVVRVERLHATCLGSLTPLVRRGRTIATPRRSWPPGGGWLAGRLSSAGDMTVCASQPPAAPVGSGRSVHRQWPLGARTSGIGSPSSSVRHWLLRQRP